MQVFYPFYARKSSRHKWNLQTAPTNTARALLNYRNIKKHAPDWEYALCIIGAEYFDNRENDNLRVIPFNRLDIDAEFKKSISMMCPKCSASDPVSSVGSLYNDPPDDAGRAEYVTWAELEDAGGYIVCEYCETKLVLTAEYKRDAAK